MVPALPMDHVPAQLGGLPIPPQAIYAILARLASSRSGLVIALARRIIYNQTNADIQLVHLDVPAVLYKMEPIPLHLVQRVSPPSSSLLPTCRDVSRLRHVKRVNIGTLHPLPAPGKPSRTLCPI